MAEAAFLISCEHGGNRVPEPWHPLFAGHEEVLQSHRGYDLGILPFARRLAQELGAPIETAEVTRLLVDLNRSEGTPGLFSEFSRHLSARQKKEILRLHYHPYRQAVQEKAAGLVAAGQRVLHLSVHSFTPELRGQVRNADIGLLYDPARPLEKGFCLGWQQALKARAPHYRVRRNYPYRGAADGLVRTLRQHFSADDYLGVELEINQRLPAPCPAWQQLQQTLIATLRDLRTTPP